MLAALFGKRANTGALEPLSVAQAPTRFGLGKRNWQTDPATLPDGHRVYAVGDIHGSAELLNDLLARIEADAASFSGQVHLVFLGDYVDRGAHSRRVLETLKTKPWPAAWHPIFLRGNHDQALLDFLESPTESSHWLSWGGDAVLGEYGLGLFSGSSRVPLPELGARLKQALDADGHLSVLKGTVFHHSLGDYLFVHAGVRPMLALKDQLEHDLTMIRDDFAGRPHGLPQRVVYGHVITAKPLDLSDRLGLDTGAFSSGILTAAVLEGATTRFLQT